MSGEWEQQGRGRGARRLALPVVLVVAAALVGVLARTDATEPDFSVLVDEQVPDRPQAEPADDTAAGGRWLSVAGGPLSARDEAVVATAGDEVVVWGGRTLQSPEHLADGAVYNPGTDRWRPMAPSPLAGRIGAAAAWTGRELIVWGGTTNGRVLRDGGAYDPAADRWRRLPQAPLSPRQGAIAVAVGTTVVIWGGRENAAQFHEPSGAVFDATRRRWRRIPAGPLDRRRDRDVSAVAVGDSVVIWSASPRSARVAGYDVATRQWRVLSTPRFESGTQPAFLSMDGAAFAWGTWTQGDDRPLALTFTTKPDWWSTIALPPFPPEPGRQLLGSNGIAVSWSAMGGGIFFDSVANRWHSMSTQPRPLGVGWPAQTWVDDRLFVWHGLADPDAQRRALVWLPPDPWERIAGSPVAIPGNAGAVWTGWLRDQQQVLLWGGRRGAPTNDGAAYDPALALWETMPRAPIAGRFDAATVWTGDEMVVLGGRGKGDHLRRDGAAYDPLGRTWRRLPAAPAPVERGGVAVSRGSLFAAGVRDGVAVVGELRAEGSRWRRLAAPPLPRAAHLAVVWTGYEIWVLDTGASGRISGAAFDPDRRRWRRLPPLAGVRGPAAMLWGGRRLFVVDQAGTTTSLGLSLGTWRRHPRSALRGGPVSLAWTGRRLVAYLPGRSRMASLDPRAAAWADQTPPQLLRVVDEGGTAMRAEMVWTGRNLFVFGAGTVAKLGGDL